MRWEIPAVSREKRSSPAAWRPEQVIFPSISQGHSGRTSSEHCSPRAAWDSLSCPTKGTGGTGSQDGGQRAQPAPALLAKPQGLESKETFLGTAMEGRGGWRSPGRVNTAEGAAVTVPNTENPGCSLRLPLDFPPTRTHRTDAPFA